MGLGGPDGPPLLACPDVTSKLIRRLTVTSSDSILVTETASRPLENHSLKTNKVI